MLKILFDANVVYDVILIIALVLCIIAMIRTSWGKYFFGALIYIVLIGTAIYSAVEIDDYNSASGGIFGQFSKPPTTNNLTVKDLEFNMDNIELTQKDASNDMLYEARFETDEIVDVTNYTKYGVFINDIPVEITEFSVDYLLATYEYNFYGENQQLILNDTLKLKFAFYKQCSKFIVQSNGGSQAVKQWNDFFKKNSFVVTMKETETDLKQTKADQLSLVKFHLVENSTDLVLRSYYSLKTNTGIENPPLSNLDYDKSRYIIKGWSLDKANIVDLSSVSVTENVDLYAVYDIATYEVTFYGDETKTFTVQHGQGVLSDISNEIPSVTEKPVDYYRFTGWKAYGNTWVGIEGNYKLGDFYIDQNYNFYPVWGAEINLKEMNKILFEKMKEKYDITYPVLNEDHNIYYQSETIEGVRYFKLLLGTKFGASNVVYEGQIGLRWKYQIGGTTWTVVDDGLASKLIKMIDHNNFEPFSRAEFVQVLDDIFNSADSISLEKFNTLNPKTSGGGLIIS